MTMQVPQYRDVKQPLDEFIAEHRDEIDVYIRSLSDKPLKFPIDDELRNHIVLISSGKNSLYSLWCKTAKPVRV